MDKMVDRQYHLPSQHPLSGFEDYVCTFQCLTHCPFPDGDCIWNDPDIGCYDLVEYPEFFQWRFQQIFGNSNEPLVITPDMMDEYFPEPKDPTQQRCPRCLSTEVVIGYIYIKCRHCGYNEPLVDFPENVR